MTANNAARRSCRRSAALRPQGTPKMNTKISPPEKPKSHQRPADTSFVNLMYTRILPLRSRRIPPTTDAFFLGITRKVRKGHVEFVDMLPKNKRGLHRNPSAQTPNPGKPGQVHHTYLPLQLAFHLNGIYCDSLMSSKCSVPVLPPAAGLFFVPTPMVTVLTLVRSTPNAARSITHSFHLESWVAARSS